MAPPDQFHPTSSSVNRARSALNIGHKIYRRLSILRPSKRPPSPPPPPPPLSDSSSATPPPSAPSSNPPPSPPPISPAFSAPQSPRIPREPLVRSRDSVLNSSVYDRKTRPQHRDTPTAALDSSPVESYTSIDVTAERVAVALERIAKQKLYLDNDEQPLDGEPTAKETVIPLIINALKCHSEDPKVVDRALTALRSLTVDADCRQRIGECGGIEALVEAMQEHSLRVRIQTQACLALANLAFKCPPNKERFAECNGLAAVVAALSLHKTVEHVQAWGCFAVRNLTNGLSEKEHEIGVSVGAVEVLVNALDAWPKSSTVQEQSLIALTNIANGSPVAVARIRDVGGIQSLVRTLENNCGATVLAEIGMSLAMVLVSDESTQRTFGESGGIEAITAILDEHRGHTGISVKGCAAFRQLAFVKENRDLMGRCGGIRVIIAAMMDVAASNSETATVMLKALSNSTFDNMSNKTLAGKLGGIEATLDLMSLDLFEGETSVIEDGCRVLRNLTDGVFANHRILIRNRGIPTILDAARSHGQLSPGVAEHGVAIFVNLAANRAILGQVREGSGDLTAVALELKELHPESETINTQVSDLISILEPSEGQLTPNSRGGKWESGPLSPAAISPELERTLRPSKSLRRSLSREGASATRLQRLTSLPLPLGQKENRV